MSIDTVIAEIDAEIARLQQAQTLLAGLQGRTTTAPTKKPAKRKLSAAGRSSNTPSYGGLAATLGHPSRVNRA